MHHFKHSRKADKLGISKSRSLEKLTAPDIIYKIGVSNQMNTVEKKQSTDAEKDLTTIAVKGRIQTNEFIQALENFYQGEYTLNLLWDLTAADISEMEKHQMEEIISTAKKYAHLRPGGKTAIVTTRAVDYGISRMFEILAEIKNHPIRHHVFYDIKEAKNWLEMQD
jgi:hypothetical protein